MKDEKKKKTPKTTGINSTPPSPPPSAACPDLSDKPHTENATISKNKDGNANNISTTTENVATSAKIASDCASPNNDDAQKKSQHYKEIGNILFQSKNYIAAVKNYQTALESLPHNNITQTKIGEKESYSSDEAMLLEISLHSNLALAYQKIGKLGPAEEECCRAIVLNETNAKLYYRRSTIREQQHQERYRHPPKPITNTDSITGALEDIRNCISLLKNSGGKGLRGAQIAETRLLHECELLANENDDTVPSTIPAVPQSPQETEAASSPSIKFDKSTLPKILSPSQQKSILEKFLSQSMQFQKPGEAYFVINVAWFQKWLQYTRFSRQDHSQFFSCRLWYTPSPSKESEDDDSDDDCSTISSSSSHENTDELPPQPPGPINNSCLFLPRTLYNQTWLMDKFPTLKPNQIRGYHYEILPREAYNALVCWYTEVTPSICCRTISIDDTMPKVGLPLYVMDMPKPDDLKATVRVAARCAACGSAKAPKMCQPCKSVQYCGRGCQESHWMYHKWDCKPIQHSLVKEDNIAVTGCDDRRAPGRKRSAGRGGLCGLNNLGNTCFMNSALQCLSHATPLTQHFLNLSYKNDLNPSNPLSTPGNRLALQYNSLLRDLWLEKNTSNHTHSVSPTGLKRAIAIYAPRFAGSLQHDSQEFLAYLLDGLHEDLNRIRKAQYVEMPDCDGTCEDALFGQISWDAYKKRNDSLILDTFYGQFKSTCVCPFCSKVSKSFDAFNHVSLEIPRVNVDQKKEYVLTKIIPVLTFPDEGNGGVPVRYGVVVNINGNVGDLKQSLRSIGGINGQEEKERGGQIVICEVYQHMICSILEDSISIASIDPDDFIVAYHLAPFTTDCMHVIVTNHHVTSLETSQQTQETKTIGFPLLLSLPRNFNCTQIWEFLWKRVNSICNHSEEHKSNLNIRIVDQTGKPQNILEDEDNLFPMDSAGVGAVPPTDEELTSIIPPNSDVKIVDALGEKCRDHFLFLALEWTITKLQDRVSSPSREHQQSTFLQRMEKFTNHPSMLSLSPGQQKSPPSSSTQMNDNIVTLEKCFQHFTKPERLDENNKWYCNKCKEHVRARKTMELWRLPNILIIHLKRFGASSSVSDRMNFSVLGGMSHGRREKLETLVHFPRENLNMAEFCASTNENYPGGSPFILDDIPAIYDLFAVVNHHGRMGFGHYTAFARRWNDDADGEDISDADWMLFDDASVRKVDRENVVTNQAYVLFYRRRIFT